MCGIVLSCEDNERISLIESELELTLETFMADSRERLSDEQWALLKSYAAGCIRQVLEVGTTLHRLASQHDAGFAHTGRGTESFVRAGLAAWRDSFAPIVEVWRVAELFDRIEGGERRLLADIATLEAMAANRMFRSWDEAAAKLFTHDA